ncbi:Mariner Mos1 transposase [Eumeta japonica]|uniref:Mariner Mos1 transposase n=1 Tax=Eumeta variegata TaxID=151549 RepID=A0A4C1XUP7_EUMVA|nr:Mariner Mos1 transposase [Eumeta japonica]
MLLKYDYGRSNAVHDNVTGDETWIYYYDPLRRRQSCERIFETYKVEAVQVIQGKQAPQTITEPGLTHNKLMLCVWWDWKRIIHYELLAPGKTINSDLYCQDLIKLDCSRSLNWLFRRDVVGQSPYSGRHFNDTAQYVYNSDPNTVAHDSDGYIGRRLLFGDRLQAMVGGDKSRAVVQSFYEMSCIYARKLRKFIIEIFKNSVNNPRKLPAPDVKAHKVTPLQRMGINPKRMFLPDAGAQPTFPGNTSTSDNLSGARASNKSVKIVSQLTEVEAKEKNNSRNEIIATAELRNYNDIKANRADFKSGIDASAALMLRVKEIIRTERSLYSFEVLMRCGTGTTQATLDVVTRKWTLHLPRQKSNSSFGKVTWSSSKGL